MSELLNSNYPPLKTTGRSFEKVFYDELSKSKEIRIASAYISEDSLTQLIGLYDNGFTARLDLVIGMHFFEGFTKLQLDALMKLSSFLTENTLGRISLSTVSKYHGKLYVFNDKDNNYTSIIGSSNLTKIHTSEKVYDTDIFIDDFTLSENIYNFIDDLRTKYCKEISVIDQDRIPLRTRSDLFVDHTDVNKVTKENLAEIKSNLILKNAFILPLKTEPKSGLNAFHGKGRENKSNGIVIPRDWYEVELIVPKSITDNPAYPKKDFEFIVITDDGYEFKCKTSGDYSKNFRSAVDLKVLGRWIKGRLEDAGCLKLGEVVTDSTFEKYGRDSITLLKTNIENKWFLDFGPKK